MRNPLTVALVAMAVHTGVALVVGWPFPSVATFVSGLVAVAGAVLTPRAPPKATAGIASVSVFLPGVVPVPLTVAGFAAILGWTLAGATRPLRNVAVALPALTFLVTAMTL